MAESKAIDELRKRRRSEEIIAETERLAAEHYRVGMEKRPRIFEKQQSPGKFLKEGVKAVRRNSVGIKWSETVEVPEKLSKLQKWRLGITPDVFLKLEAQLYLTNTLKEKDGCEYQLVPSITDISNFVYIKLVRYLDVYQLMRLLIWRHFNHEQLIPMDSLLDLFEKDTSLYEQINKPAIENTTIKNTCLTVKKHTGKRLFWTVTQRSAARNTRDHYIKRFIVPTPMLCDLNFTESNKAFMKEFLIILLKAKVQTGTICKICCDVLGFNNEEDKKAEEIILEIVEHPERVIQEAAVQRKSITDFSQDRKDISAAIKIQWFYRKRLKRIAWAVRIIEEWWEPARIEGMEVRRDIAEHFEQQVTQAGDDFNYDKLYEDLKKDYHKDNLKNPQKRDFCYWFQNIFVASMITSVAMVLHVFRPFDFIKESMGSRGDYDIGLNIIIIGILHLFTLCRMNQWIKWTQTILLLILFSTLLHTFHPFLEYSIPVIMLFVPILGRYWWVTLIGNGILFLFIWGEDTAINIVTGVWLVYLPVTVVASSREGKIIDMLHKVATNYVVVVMIGGYIAAAAILACTCVQSSEL